MIRSNPSRTEVEELRTLRTHLRLNAIDWPEFALSAAGLYLRDRKPRRAQALMETVSDNQLRPDLKKQYRALTYEIAANQADEHKSCSLTMIVRDESDNITQCLDTVDAIMDEIVVCDTGSTDDTVSKARMYGATIINRRWADDFSSARNAAIDHAHGDWIFWMDADDRLEKQSAHVLQRLWRTEPAQAAAIRVRSLVPGGGEVEFMQVRLFPRLDSLRFQRRIHEQIMFAAKRLSVPFSRRPEITIVHTGYADKQLVYRKSLRNKKLLQREYERTPADPTLLMNMGDCHLSLGEYTEAYDCYSAICGRPDNYHRNSDVYVQAHINLAALYMKDKKIKEATKFFLRSLFLDPSRIESHLQLGRLYLGQRKTRKAADHFLKAARLRPPLRLTASNNTMVRLNAIWHLAEIYIQAGKHEEAETILTAAVQAYPRVPRFHTQLGDIYRTRDDYVRAARHYSHALHLSETRNQPAYLGMAAVYQHLGDLRSARQFLERGLALHPQSVEIKEALQAAVVRQKQLQTA